MPVADAAAAVPRNKTSAGQAGRDLLIPRLPGLCGYRIWRLQFTGNRSNCKKRILARNYGSKRTLDASDTTARKVKRTLSSGQVHIYASFNNTIVTITDQQGNTVCWGSSGSAGFKGSRKSTPFAARLAAEQAVKTAMSMGIQEVDLIVKGPGPGRESAIRAVQSMGVRVRSISDITPVPHNGCRPPKKRRV